MRKLISLVLIVFTVVTACQKNTTSPTPSSDVGLQFTIEQTDFSGLKSTQDVPVCSDLPMDYVKFTLGGVDYTSPVISMNGLYKTKVVKLDPGDYSLTGFLVYSDVLPIGEGPEDVLIKAAPSPNSEYWDLMKNPLDINVSVDEFKKKEVTVDVLCYDSLFYDEFGFTWFNANENVIHQLPFFGDVCTSKLDDFIGSDYENQENGLQMDMPAIFKVEVYQDGNLIRDFSNDDSEHNWGEGDPLVVYWPDDLDVTEHYTFKLYTLLPVGGGFDFVLTDTFEFDDVSDLITGDDGVVDFEVGNCNIDESDYVYPAWINLPLPSDNFTMTVTSPYGPSSQGTYIQANFSGIDDGYDVYDGVWGAWCADEFNYIYLDTPYTAHFINSLQPLPPDFTKLSEDQVHELNWLFNHLPSYFSGINLSDLTDYSGDGYDATSWSIIQDAIWNITDGQSNGGLAHTMSSDASLHTDYQPIPGEYAAVFMVVADNVQMLFILIDP